MFGALQTAVAAALLTDGDRSVPSLLPRTETLGIVCSTESRFAGR